MPNTKTEKKKNLGRFFVQSIVFGLIFPCCILVGLGIGWMVGRNLGKPMDFVLALAGAILGLIAGTAILLWYVTRSTQSK